MMPRSVLCRPKRATWLVAVGLVAVGLVAMGLVVLWASRPRAQTADETRSAESLHSGAETPADEAGPPAGRPLRFRRIDAPADKIQQLTQGYIVIRRDLFEQLLARVAKTNGGAAGQPARITEATYWARLAGDNLVEGGGSWRIEHRGSRQAAIALGPTRLALGRPRWREQPEAAAPLGLGSSGQPQLMVESSGDLLFDWSLRGEPSAAGPLTFEFSGPGATASKLYVLAPSDVALEATPGVATRLEQPPAGAPLASAAEDLVWWRVDLGSRAGCRLRVYDSREPAGGSTRQAMAHESLQYLFTPQGIELVYRCRLRAAPAEADQLVVELDWPLEVVAVETSGVQARWTDSKAWRRYSATHSGWFAAGSAESHAVAAALTLVESERRPRRQVVVSLGEPIGQERDVTIRAVAPLRMGAFMRLPRARALDVHWLTGNTRLATVAPLVIERVEGLDCHQAATDSQAAASQGGAYFFSHESPHSDLRASVVAADVRLAAEVGVTVRLGESSVDGRLVSLLSAKEGRVFQLQAALVPGWAIENVSAFHESEETDAANLVEDWSVSPSGGPTRRLFVRLSEPLRAGAQMRLVIEGRLARPAASAPSGQDWLAAETLKMLELSGGQVSRRLVAIHCPAPYTLQVRGGGRLDQLAPDQLSKRDSRLLDTAGGSVIFRDGPAAEGVGFRRSRQQARYAAEINIALTVEESRRIETYRLRCNPLATYRVERVLVHISQPRGQALRWSLVSGELGAGGATTEPRQRLVGPQRYEITLPEGLTRPFELRAARVLDAEGQLSIALASLPEAATQRGIVRVLRRGEAMPQIQYDGARPIAAASATQSSSDVEVGVYRYEPSARTEIRVAAAEPSDRQPLAWAWRSHARSRFEVSGAVRQSVEYYLENWGRRTAIATLPGDASLATVTVDGEPVSTPDISPGTGRLEIPLPPARRFVVLRLEYGLPATPGRWWAHPLGHKSLATAFPVVDLPIVRRDWTVWLPPQFDLLAGPTSDARPDRHRTDWGQRFLSPLDAGGQEPMDLFSAADWRRLGQATSAESIATPFEGDRKIAERGAAAERLGPLAESNPWTADPHDGGPPPPSAWRRFDFVLADSAEPALTVYRPASVTALRWSLFFFAAVITWWFGRRGGWRSVFVFTLSAAVAVIVSPWSVAALATGVFQGVVVAALLCLLVPTGVRRFKDRRPPEGISRRARPSAVAPAVLAMIALGAASLATAWGEPTVPPKPPPIYRVYSPVDDKGQPQGDYLYVPEPFGLELHRRAARTASRSGDWLVRSANYEVELRSSGESPRPVLGDFQAAYEIETFRAAVTISVPLDDRLNLLDVKLNGQACVWKRAAGAIRVEAPTSGRHRLTLLLRPKVEASAAASQFDVAIPPCPASTLRVATPEEGAAVLCPTALGQESQLEAPARRQFQLGPAERLKLLWTSPLEAGSASVSAREYVWFHVSPGGVEADARFVFQVEGAARRLQLAADAAWREVQITADRELSRIRSSRGDLRTVQLEFAEPVTGRVEVRGRFVLRRGRAAGGVSPPKLASYGVRRSSRWVAISTAPGLMLESVDSEGLAAIDLEEFLAAWQAAGGAAHTAAKDAAPQAYSVTDLFSPWSMTVTPRRPSARARQQIRLGAEPGQWQVHYSAEIEPSGQPVLRHELKAPAGMVLDHLAVTTDEGIQSLHRWSATADGHVTLFLRSPLAGPHRLVVLGRLPTEYGSRPLPHLSLQTAKIERTRFRIFRRPEVRVRVDQAQNLDPAGESLIEDDLQGMGRTVAWLEAVDSGRQATARLTVEPNNPRISATLVTTLRRGSDQWLARLEYRLQVKQGVVDVLRLDIPARWKGPFRLTPLEAYERVEMAGGSRSHLVIWPEAAIDNEYRIAIEGPIEMPSGIVRAPEIEPLGVKPSELNQYLVVPTKNQREQIAWKITPGLQSDRLPADFRSPDSEPKNDSVFRVVSRPYQAVLISVEPISGVPLVRLADTRVALGPGGCVHGLIRWDLEPAGLRECLLELPADCQLVQAKVGGLPAAVRKLSARRYSLALISEQLGQRIELVYVTAEPPVKPGEYHAAAPQLYAPGQTEPLHVERTIWTVSGPAPLTLAGESAGRITSAASHDRRRLRAVASVVRDASNFVSERFEPENGRWHRRWAARLVRARRDLERNLSPADDSPWLDEVTAIWREHEGVARRLGTLSAWQQLNRRPAATAARPGSPSLGGKYRLYCEFQGEAPQLALEPVVQPPSRWRQLAAPLAICIAVLVAVWVLAARQSVREFLKRWPHLAGAAAGIAWWLWLAPSLLGWFLVAVSLAGGLRSGWARRPRRAAPTLLVEGSTHDFELTRSVHKKLASQNR